jgi:hypothetical protein
MHPVEQHLTLFDRHFREALRSRIGLVDLVTRYIVRQKGKRVRPILVLLSAELCGGINERSYRGATLVEILHTATLVHSPRPRIHQCHLEEQDRGLDGRLPALAGTPPVAGSR